MKRSSCCWIPNLCVEETKDPESNNGEGERPHPDMFDRAKLVEILTAPYIGDSGDGIVALDPHALKKLFTTNGNLLQEMGVEGERKRLAMAGETGAIEEDCRQGLTSHATRLNEAVRIGDRLSKMEGQRARAAEAMDLLEFFKVLAKLKSITHELESKELDKAAKSCSDFLEQELLDLFERTAGRSPPEVALMRECSDILFALNEGDHLQSRFVFFVVTQAVSKQPQP
ncbi:hypothetical protein Esi_0606_0005 [Ectocarpus siliculosus]|uniref:Exocyst complex component Sec10 n=1 Tax=Ectocarpus siliculosus TaxID=2880 RepID=D7G517_ECTSI|nr:hypothetical protein Esi_0606_0005 [Ectocarpus siliculosus]|eukprot:CBJ33780.1 hypothetical protein Esi_0606_0005 [Ectocarpus siliculosus]